MNAAQSELDLYGTRVRDAGARAALSAIDESWLEDASRVLDGLIASGRQFSINDIREEVGPGPSSGSLGALVLNAMKAHRIRNAGWSSTSHIAGHKRRIGLYEGVR